MKYEKRVVLYADILGFKNKVKASITDDDTFEKIKSALNYLFNEKNENYNGPLKSNGDDQISVFSDNIVFSAMYDENALFYVINMAYFLINSLIDYGFIIRGAITIGDLYHDERIVFGPALNQAYEIESTIANYPRVIVDKRIVSTHIKECYDANQYEAEYKYEEKYFDIILKEDIDGFYYINFLNPQHQFDDDYYYNELLLKTKALIEEGLIIQYDNLKVYSKYVWLKNYFNTTVSKLTNNTSLLIK